MTAEKEYGLFIRNSRTGKWINLSVFAKVFHHWSGEPGGNRVTVPSMGSLLLPVRHGGNGRAVWHEGETTMHHTAAADYGLTDSQRIWHAVTLISSDTGLPEGDWNDLESVPGAGCILNYEDNGFYTSPPDIQRRTHLPVRILTGVVYV